MRRRTLLTLALVAASGACTMERESADDDTVIENRSAQVSAPDMEDLNEVTVAPGPGQEPPYGTPEPTPPTAIPDLQGGMTVTGRFIPVNEYPINATVTVSAVGWPGPEGGEGTLVSISVLDAPLNTVLDAALNRGPCGDTGPEVAQVDGELRVGTGGVGAVADTLQIPTTTVMNGQHVVTLNLKRAGPPTPPVACAPIPVNRPQVQP